jgi:hypothetical protein
MWTIPTQKQLDEIPRLYETEGVPTRDKMVYLHFFIFACDWYIIEYDGADRFFGYAILNGDTDCAEFGYVSYQELKDININGIEVDCESKSLWEIRPVSSIDKIRL